jgi:NAD(P)-dependent dehydrogenase (short-subunit alcohol dehydrogenase family)
MGRLDDKVAFVTGGTRGLGEAICRALAAEGAQVAVTGRTEADGQKVAQSIRDAGGRAEYVALDLSQEERVQGAILQAVEAFGKLTSWSTMLHPQSSSPDRQPVTSPKRPTAPSPRSRPRIGAR